MLNNKSIHDYIFYIILDNISFGILKNDYYKEHFDYLMALKDMEPLLFEGIYNNFDWPTQLELMAASLGYVVIANFSIETTEIKDRVYVVYLPSNPNSYQLQELSKINPEFKQTNIDVSVEGNLKEAFLRERLALNNNFIPQKFLDDYISNNLYILKKEPKKVS